MIPVEIVELIFANLQDYMPANIVDKRRNNKSRFLLLVEKHDRRCRAQIKILPAGILLWSTPIILCGTIENKLWTVGFVNSLHLHHELWLLLNRGGLAEQFPDYGEFTIRWKAGNFVFANGEIAPQTVIYKLEKMINNNGFHSFVI